MPLAFARSILTGGNSKSFTLTRSAASVNEGSTVTFTLNTSGLADETIPYAITGISSADLSSGSLTGSIAINSDETGSASVTLANDFSTEGTETMTFTVGESYQQYADENGYSTSVTVNDTSVSPTVSAVTRGASSVNEGSTVGISVTTSNLGNAKRIYYKLTGIQTADISSVTTGSPNTGTVTYSSSTMTTEAGYITTNSSGTGNLRITTAADLTTEGAQTITFTVTRLADGSGTTLATDGSSSTTITINDTSITHPTGQILFTPYTSTTANNSYAWNGWGQNPNYSNNLSNTDAGTATFNWTVPSGMSDASIVCVGGGASGWNGSYSWYSVYNYRNAVYGAGGPGGGGGGLIAADKTGFTPGDTYVITVGKGGKGGQANTSQFGINGGKSTFRKNTSNNAGLMTANGGLAGNNINYGYSNSGNQERAGGSASTYSQADGTQTTSWWTGTGGHGGRGWARSTSVVQGNASYYAGTGTGGGGGGAGGWGNNGGAGGGIGQGGSAGNGGGGGGSGYTAGGAGGGAGLDGSYTTYSAGGTAPSDNTLAAGNAGAATSAWQGHEYGFGGGGGGARTNTGSSAGQTLYIQAPNAGSGAVRIKWSSGSNW